MTPEVRLLLALARVEKLIEEGVSPSLAVVRIAQASEVDLHQLDVHYTRRATARRAAKLALERQQAKEVER